MFDLWVEFGSKIQLKSKLKSVPFTISVVIFDNDNVNEIRLVLAAITFDS